MDDQKPDYTAYFKDRPTKYLQTPQPMTSSDATLIFKARPKTSEELASIFAEEAKKESLSRLAVQLGPRYQRGKVSISGYQIYNEAQKPVKERLIAIGRNMKDFVSEARNLILYGSVGTGKDHLLASLLYVAAEKGFDTQWVSCQSFFGQSRDRISAGQKQEGLIRQLAKPAVLGMSDPIPPAGETKVWDIQLLYLVLDARNRAMKPTWITANAESEEELQLSLSAPVWDRMRDGAEIVRCFWPSFRGRKHA